MSKTTKKSKKNTKESFSLAAIKEILSNSQISPGNNQGIKMSSIEVKLRTTLNKMDEISKNIPNNANSEVLNKIKSELSELTNKFKNDNFLKLIEIVDDKAKLWQQINLPDVLGIRGLGDNKIAASRFLNEQRNNFINHLNVHSAPIISNQLAQQQPQPILGQSPASILKELLEINPNNIQAPDITAENYVTKIHDSMAQVLANDYLLASAYTSAYIDAATILFQQSSSNRNDLNNILFEAGNELYQNMRLLLDERATNELKQTFEKIIEHLKSLNGGDTSFKFSLVCDQTQIYQGMQASSERELRQDGQIALILKTFDEISTWIEKIIDVFEKKMKTSLSQDDLQLALVCGANPNARLLSKTDSQGNAMEPEETYNTPLHKAAFDGNLETTNLLLNSPETEVDPLLKPLWNFWPMHYAVKFIKNVQIFISEGKYNTPIEDGATPLFVVANAWLNEKDETKQKKYAGVAKALLDKNANPYIYNYNATAPIDLLAKCTGKNGYNDIYAEISKKASNELMLSFASTSNLDDDKGAGAIAITASQKEQTSYSVLEWLNDIENQDVRSHLLSLQTIQNQEKNIIKRIKTINGPNKIDWAIKTNISTSSNETAEITKLAKSNGYNEEFIIGEVNSYSYLPTNVLVFLACMTSKIITSSASTISKTIGSDFGSCALLGMTSMAKDLVDNFYPTEEISA
jgi:hypothetical protein